MDGEELVDFGSEAEAGGVATWVRYQLQAGTSLKELGLMLKGQSKQEAEGGAAAVAPDPEPKQKKTKKAQKTEDAPREAGSSDEGGPDTAALVGGTVSALKKGLASGDYDAVLADVLAAEKGGKGRKSAIAAIEARIEEAG